MDTSSPRKEIRVSISSNFIRILYIIYGRKIQKFASSL